MRTRRSPRNQDRLYNSIGRELRAAAKTELIEATQPFKVRTGCGHIVIRRMREATAGVPYTPDTIIEAPNGRPCEDCEASNGR